MPPTPCADSGALQRVHLPKRPGSQFKDVSAGKSFESVAVTANPMHKWYFASDLTPSEAILLKINDAAAGQPNPKTGGVIADGIPHTAIQIPGTETAEPRESIEMRCLVFY
jgi:hypothetical protein